MSAFAEVMEKCVAQANDLGLGLDESLMTAVAKGLGPSIYNQDSASVACSDQDELDRVKKNFLIGKLGMADGPELDAALAGVCGQMSQAHRKQRVVFYSLLVKHFGKEGHYA